MCLGSLPCWKTQMCPSFSRLPRRRSVYLYWTMKQSLCAVIVSFHKNIWEDIFSHGLGLLVRKLLEKKGRISVFLLFNSPIFVIGKYNRKKMKPSTMLNNEYIALKFEHLTWTPSFSRGKQLHFHI